MADAPHATTASCEGSLVVVNFSKSNFAMENFPKGNFSKGNFSMDSLNGDGSIVSGGLLRPNSTTGLMLKTRGGGWTPNVSIEAFAPFAITLSVEGGGGGAGVVEGVRYAFEDMPCPYMGCALYSKEGLPVLPFDLSCS